jgi:hypothetical protein
MEACFAQLEPVRLHGHRFTAEEGEDDAERFVHARALSHGVDAEHVGVGGECARANAEHRAAAGHVVQLEHAVGEDERVVVGQAADAGAEADGLRALGGGGDHQLRRGDDLPAGAVVFAEPGLIEVQPVQVFDQFEVAVERHRGFFPRGGGAMKTPKRMR